MLASIEKLQRDLAHGLITIDAPCGAEPLIQLLGGIHARAAINITQHKFPTVETEFSLVKNLISLLSSK